LTAKRAQDSACYSWIVLSFLSCQINETTVNQGEYHFIFFDEVRGMFFTFQFGARRRWAELS
jgi:hypothetical protein